MNYYLYRICMTGMIEWRCARENSPEQAKAFIGCSVVPGFPVSISSRQFGSVNSSFDVDITIVSGTKRYGENERGDLVLCLEWRGSYYNLFVTGYPPFVVGGTDWRRDGTSYWIMANGHRIASIRTVNKQAAECGYMEVERAMKLQMDDQYAPLAEIFAAIPALAFAPLPDTPDAIKNLTPREEEIIFSPLVKRALRLCLTAHKG